MKKLLLTMGLAGISAIGFGQNTSYTIGAGFTRGIFFKLNGTIQINDSTVTITTDRTWSYDIVPSTTGVIYITDGVQTGTLAVSNTFTPKKVKGFIPTHNVVHTLNINNPSHSTIYYTRLN